jgi:N-acetyl-gamma-glutamyl-phosphate reductase
VADPDAEPGETLALIDLEEADDIVRALRSLQPTFDIPMTFMVMCGGWKRGISVSIHFKSSIAEDKAESIYNEFYEDHGFTFISSDLPNLTEVVGTNKCIINLQKVGDRLVINAVLDDMVKGAAAMAVHDMNLLFGLQERVGLMLKSH